jgi:hypothetical protein
VKIVSPLPDEEPASVPQFPKWNRETHFAADVPSRTFSIICINDVACDSETLPICAIPQPVQTIREHSERTGHQKRAGQIVLKPESPTPRWVATRPRARERWAMKLAPAQQALFALCTSDCWPISATSPVRIRYPSLGSRTDRAK